MKASDLYVVVSARLADLDAVQRWPWTKTDGAPGAPGVGPSLQDFLNNGMREVVLQRPDANPILQTVKLTPGPRQALPAGALALLDVVRNMGADGTTPGSPILPVAREALDSSMPGWYAGEDGLAVDNYAYDKLLNPLVYWVSPAVSATNDVHVEIVFAQAPALVTSPADDLPLSELYANALIMWMLYECLSGDSADASMTKAQAHLASFYQSLGAKLRADLFFQNPSRGGAV